MEKPEAQKEHRWLQQLAGNWTFEEEMEGEILRGTCTVRPLGDLWIVAEMEGGTPGGGTSRSMVTLGFDPKRERFVGTFIGDSMTHLWLYDGRLDSDGKALHLDSMGPDWENPSRMIPYRDTIRIDGPDRWALVSQVKKSEGAWEVMMETLWRRAK